MNIRKIIIAGFLTIASIVNAAEYSIITHPSNATNSISAADAKSILVGALNRWETGSAVRLAVYKGGDFNESVIKAITGRSGSQFKRAWKKLIFTGKGIAPREQGDVESMVSFVMENENSFGYVPVGEEGGAKVLIVK
ncbi:MAG: hypothetical protein ACPGN3_15630 [Opitutales bacterium]